MAWAGRDWIKEESLRNYTLFKHVHKKAEVKTYWKLKNILRMFRGSKSNQHQTFWALLGVIQKVCHSLIGGGGVGQKDDQSLT